MRPHAPLRRSSRPVQDLVVLDRVLELMRVSETRCADIPRGRLQLGAVLGFAPINKFHVEA